MSRVEDCIHRTGKCSGTPSLLDKGCPFRVPVILVGGLGPYLSSDQLVLTSGSVLMTLDLAEAFEDGSILRMLAGQTGGGIGTEGHLADRGAGDQANERTGEARCHVHVMTPYTPALAKTMAGRTSLPPGHALAHCTTKLRTSCSTTVRTAHTAQYSAFVSCRPSDCDSLCIGN